MYPNTFVCYEQSNHTCTWARARPMWDGLGGHLSTGLPATSCDNLRTPTPWPNVRDYEGWTGLSHLPPTPQPCDMKCIHPPLYPATSPAYIETTQVLSSPRPYGSIGKGLGRTRKHDEPPPQHKSKSIHEHGMIDKALSQVWWTWHMDYILVHISRIYQHDYTLVHSTNYIHKMKTWLFGEKKSLLFSPILLQGAKPSKVASLLLYYFY
jgi:hypothetical protein